MLGDGAYSTAAMRRGCQTARAVRWWPRIEHCTPVPSDRQSGRGRQPRHGEHGPTPLRDPARDRPVGATDPLIVRGRHSVVAEATGSFLLKGVLFHRVVLVVVEGLIAGRGNAGERFLSLKQPDRRTLVVL